jgi:tRNA-modifying protein YgfZ
MKAALLSNRGVVKVTGDDAGKFLNGLVTIDVANVTPAQAAFGALLTPQGKIIVDFLLTAAEPGDGGGYFLDCPRALAPMLAERLNFYKLRAKVTVEDLSASLAVLAIWDDPGSIDAGLCYRDPRLAELGTRSILPPGAVADAVGRLGAALVDAVEYEAHRIILGVPRGGIDFVYGDAFPHETDMDQLNGVDFSKGCFIGQEVVSRIEHRGTGRTRVVPVAFPGPPPDPGELVRAGEKNVGTMGSGVIGHGLAALRLDRVEDAIASATPLVAGGITLHVAKPPWARFAFPGEAKAAE